MCSCLKEDAGVDDVDLLVVDVVVDDDDVVAPVALTIAIVWVVRGPLCM